jgi:hypothetical protein
MQTHILIDKQIQKPNWALESSFICPINHDNQEFLAACLLRDGQSKDLSVECHVFAERGKQTIIFLTE